MFLYKKILCWIVMTFYVFQLLAMHDATSSSSELSEIKQSLAILEQENEIVADQLAIVLHDQSKIQQALKEYDDKSLNAIKIWSAYVDNKLYAVKHELSLLKYENMKLKQMVVSLSNDLGKIYTAAVSAAVGYKASRSREEVIKIHNFIHANKRSLYNEESIDSKNSKKRKVVVFSDQIISSYEDQSKRAHSSVITPVSCMVKKHTGFIKNKRLDDLLQNPAFSYEDSEQDKALKFITSIKELNDSSDSDSDLDEKE